VFEAFDLPPTLLTVPVAISPIAFVIIRGRRIWEHLRKSPCTSTALLRSLASATIAFINSPWRSSALHLHYEYLVYESGDSPPRIFAPVDCARRLRPSIAPVETRPNSKPNFIMDIHRGYVRRTELLFSRAFRFGYRIARIHRPKT
jgi:hypothetical protein